MNKPIFVVVLASLTYGCGGSSSNNSSDSSDPSDSSNPGTSYGVVAPYDIAKYQNILSSSDLQVSDPNGTEGNKTSEVKDGDFDGYISDYFYADEETENLIFKMANYKMRSEVREGENFDINETGVRRSLYAEISLPDIEHAMASSPADHDEVTMLQIHNKGTDESGTGYIPHPLLRVVWEQERDGITGHYWAVMKNNAIDCSSASDSSNCYATSYDRYDLGEADLDSFTKFDLSVYENTLSIKVNDEVKVDQDIAYWEHLLSYFKAGIYNQFENGEATAYFQALRYTTTQISGSNDWDINDWKLTIPASKDTWYGSGGDSAAELEPERCESSNGLLANDSDVYHSDIDLSYFNTDEGRIHFRADMGYGTTTQNSSYIRSELRELYQSNAQPDCSTSDEDTSWYLNDIRTSATTHELTATLRVENYPNLNNQDPKVVLGQIHGWKINQALVKLLWEGEDKPVRVILNSDFERNNQDCSDCEPFSVELGTYSASEEWRYTIRTNQDGVYLATHDSDGTNTVSHLIPWGEDYQDKDGDTVSLTSEWTSTDIAFYFKAGIYPQFKPDSDYTGEVFDVSFSSLRVEHN
ncbi:polysaccharide lyase family 7 protein [Vibrio cyclitrophicus]|uniref:polysaccharide lyase family 7 protein n=1 Tax=Vibrio cyclitrophicus TaxID=47951 RepID=UPI000C83802A|nr:polysaccharide lyase family 7 protein [Vibrio cyclitrophicus]PMI08537.1 lyase [Vibrio cyclitrophicus]